MKFALESVSRLLKEIQQNSILVALEAEPHLHLYNISLLHEKKTAINKLRWSSTWLLLNNK